MLLFSTPKKKKWRQILDDWKQKNHGSVPKDRFPHLLKQCIDKLNKNMKKNLKSGFRAAGIVPLDQQQILKRLPSGSTEKDNNDNLDSSDK